VPGALYRLAAVLGCLALGVALGLALSGHGPAYIHAHPLR
jgi:hypothetical protein